MAFDLLREHAHELDVPLDRGADRLGAVHPEREPELERPERTGVLERGLERMEPARLPRHVLGAMRERRLERPHVANEEDAAGLGQEQPLAGIERDRVRALDPAKQLPRSRVAAAGSPYAPSTWNQTWRAS